MQDEASGSGSVAEKRQQDPELDVWTQRARRKFKQKQYGFQQSKMAARGNPDDQHNEEFEIAEEVTVHWFRRDLRLHDNQGLLKATEPCATLIPLYIFDPHHLDPDKRGANHLGFQLDSLRSLNNDLTQLGSRLFVAIGSPLEILENLMNTFKVVKLTFGRETEITEQDTENKITELSLCHGVDVESFWSNTLYDPDHLLSLSSGAVPPDLKSFLRFVSSSDAEPRKPVAAPTELPPPPADVDKVEGMLSTIPYVAHFHEYGYLQEDYTTCFVAGEGVAIAQMEKFVASKRILLRKNIQSNVLTKGDPTSPNPDSSGLSPYIANGSLSVRLFFQHLKKVERSSGIGMRIVAMLKRVIQRARKRTTHLSALYCREFTYLIDYATKGNPSALLETADEVTCVCKHIEWNEGQEADRMVAKWEMGKTGFPVIDACMNQLRRDGWMHNVSRHMVACFLTGGDLMVYWEEGRRVFTKYLVDSDWAICNYQWHWLSCSAFFSEYFSSYNPISTFKQFDKHGTYIRRHIPQLQNFPDQYIYEPWSAPKEVQVEAGCIIGKDYPSPMVNHGDAFRKNMRMVQLVAHECRNIEFQLTLRRQSGVVDDYKIDKHHFEGLSWKSSAT